MFDLLEKIYIELQDTKGEVKKTNERLDSLEVNVKKSNERLDSLESNVIRTNERLDSIESNVKKIGMKIDEEITPKIEALFDVYKANTETLTNMSEQIDIIQLDVNTLSIKTAYNNNRIAQIDKLVKVK